MVVEKCACRCLALLLMVALCRGEQLQMECGFIERTDRGLQCEFNQIFTSATTDPVVIELNRSIDAVSFRTSELYTVPADIFNKFPQIKHLDVELTQMKRLSPDNFKNANELKYFLARFNEIMELKSGTFVSCPLLKFLVLQYNQISVVEAGAFDGLHNLEALYLDYNRLTTLPVEILDPLTSLIHFSSAYNNLTLIPGDLFSKNDKLETMNFGHNLLTSFNDKQFELLPNLERVQFDHNRLTELDLRTCKSTEIILDKNEIASLELNKWTRFVSAWGNPVKTFVLHEHYGTGRNYNFSFAMVDEITFFVNENCCTVDNLENFHILTQSFGDLAQKGFVVTDWKCSYLKTIGYQTQNGLVVNNVCTKISPSSPAVPASAYEESTTEWNYVLPTRTTAKPRVGIYNQEDFVSSDEIESTTKPRESMEDLSLSPSIFSGLNIETLNERRTTTEANSFTAHVEQIFPTTTNSYEEQCEKGILKTVKTKIIGWKDKAARKWNDWVG